MKRSIPWLKTGRALLSLVLALAISTFPLPVRADDEPAVPAPAADAATPAPGAESPDAESQWRAELNEAKRSRSTLKKAGIVTSVAALGLLFAGNVRAASAEDIEGCERDGSDIRCNTQDGADDANARLDQGRGLYVAGALTGLVGLGLLVTSSKRTNKIEELERIGWQRGYKLSLDAGNGDRLQLVISRAF